MRPARDSYVSCRANRLFAARLALGIALSIGGLAPLIETGCCVLAADEGAERPTAPNSTAPNSTAPGAATSDAARSGRTASGATAGAVAAEIDAILDRARGDAAAADLADDATFLRRVTLDLVGRIPSVADARSFLAAPRPVGLAKGAAASATTETPTTSGADRRQAVVEALLSHPHHARHMAGLWREVLLPRDAPPIAADAFESWLLVKFRRNTPHDALAIEILTASGSLAQSDAAAFFAAHQTKPEELAASVSRSFLGVEVRCAQCHDHPTAQWKQDDFWSLAAFFARTRGPTPQQPGLPVVDVGDGEATHPKTMAKVAPRFLDGRAFDDATGEPRRAVLARWVAASDNPFFAKAAVNRIWWMLFGRGVAHPVDDLGPHNPGAHPQVLDRLAADFREHGFDTRRTIRVVTATRAYQRASVAPDGIDARDDAWGAMPVRSLSARQVYDSLLQAAGTREALEASTPAVRLERAAFLKRFEVPVRQATEFQGGIPQTLSLLNGPFVARMIDPVTGDLVGTVNDSPFLTDSQRIDTLFLATLSRFPDAAERRRAVAILSGRSDDRGQALGDILWALLNSTEFVICR